MISAPESQNLLQDTSIFQMEDPHPSMQPVSVSPPITTCHPLRPSLDLEMPLSDALEPNLPLGHPLATEHPSMECLLGTGSFVESRDTESVSSQRSSNGFHTASTDHSWCQDLTD